MLHFLNPGGLRRGRTKGVGGWVGAKHWQPFYHGLLSLQATQLPITFITGEEKEGWGGKGKKKKKKGGEEVRIDTIF